MKSSTQTKSYAERYMSLNTAQKRAVDTIDGPVMVIAGPGSGKTELLSLRVGNILTVGHAKPSNILCLTFTETAAKNMRDRLESLIGADAYRVAIYTFHSFCTDIISRYPEYFYNATSYRPASDLLQSEILEAIFEALPHKHVLGSYHPERGFAYLKECQTRIKDIKKGGLTPDRFRDILTENEQSLEGLNAILRELLPERIGKDAYGVCDEMAVKLENSGSNLGHMYAVTLREALEQVDQTGKTTPLSEWKSDYTGKDEGGVRVFKDSLSLPKLFALADVYQEYQKSLHSHGVFDYEDMILQVVEALSKNTTLRTELEEMYQYIMVDEFQDTNNAQLLLVKGISSNAVHEGRPNVCVVGDDDQAIYKFQGAEISNIHSFKELYRDVEVIVLTENYRSTQKVLDFARAVVVQGVNRLETKYTEIRKDLIAKNTKLASGSIFIHEFKTPEEEYAYIGGEVHSLLQSGVAPEEIALISREHKQLLNILPYLDALSVPYTYTRKENVFDERHVKELIVICELLSTIGSRYFERDDLLPEILAFPFWGLKRVSIWRIAENAKRENITWLAAMEQSDDQMIRNIAAFLIELGIASQTTPLEIILDVLIGSKDQPLVSENPNDDEYTPRSLVLETSFTSPYKQYYFGENALVDNPSAYINFLSSLRVFIHSLREYKEGESLRAGDVGVFVDMHTSYNIPLINETPFAHNAHSVQLLTSHGAKGLEFAYVFVVAVNDSIWAGGKKANKLQFPANLPLATAGDTEDDFIRLLYVALTRARHTLYITHHNSLLRFLASPDIPDVEKSSPHLDAPELLEHGLSVYHAPPFATDERALLEKVIEGYMLSPTHLNNYLNLIDGGPIRFLEQNILRFPQAMSASSVYGSAIHKALEVAHIEAKQSKDKTAPPLSSLITTFTKELKRGRLTPVEWSKFEARGVTALTSYYESMKGSFDGTTIVELNLAKQGVMIDGALLTGKIDKISVGDHNTWSVTDWKTGKGFEAWDEKGMTVHDSLKLHHYRYQVMMYKLLVENSRDFRDNTVVAGMLEFVEEFKLGSPLILSVPFEGSLSTDELRRVKQLAVAVYKKIVALDFPNTDLYEKSIKGILAFEDDLIAGLI